MSVAASAPIDERHPPEDRNDAALLTIRTLGRLLDDIERLRISDANRIGAGEREMGEALPHLHVVHEELEKVEKKAVKELQRAWKKHPLAAWSHGIPGAGDKLMARLIAVIGDPAFREDRGQRARETQSTPALVFAERTVSELWSYCGHGDPRRKKKAGMMQAEAFKLGNPEAKKRTWLIAAQFVKTANSPYRAVYEQARERYAERTHETKCVRCGPSGHPALPGSPWSPGHQHAAAIRYMGKVFLRDLWLEAKRLHKEGS